MKKKKKPFAINKSPVAKAVRSPGFSLQVVPSKKGKGSYQRRKRKEEHESNP